MIWKKNEVLGRMNERIVIQSVTESRSASGQVNKSWLTFATVWAAVEYKRVGTDEKEIVARETAIGNVEFTVRYRTDLNEKMRISFNSKVYDIERILPEQEKQFMILEAKTRN